jgi:CubicO group peptidase (beta-lactamase class C family)
MIGSNTKAFTGTSLALLANENKCCLLDKVKKWVPEFKFKDKWVEKEANLTDILCHRMGMQTFQGDFLLFGTDLNRKEIIEKIGSITPKYEFRTKWGYYNTGFVIAGAAIESISDMNWNEFFKKRIFTPLEMNNTVALSSEILTVENKAYAHSKLNGKLSVIDYCIMDEIGPAGSISSSAKDMSNWLLMQLNNGKFNGKQIIPQNAIYATRKPNSIVGSGRHPFNQNNFSLYGLGWKIDDYEGTKIISHTGGIPGFLSSMTIIPEQNLGIVILTNTDQNALFEALKWEIIDSYMDLPYRNYGKLYTRSSKRHAQKEEKQQKILRDSAEQKIKTDIPLKRFKGRYTNKLYGYTDIEKKKNELKISFEHHKGLVATLKHLGKNQFLCTFNNPMFGSCIVPFNAKNKQIVDFTLSLPAYLDPVKYKFLKVHE